MRTKPKRRHPRTQGSMPRTMGRIPRARGNVYSFYSYYVAYRSTRWNPRTQGRTPRARGVRLNPNLRQPRAHGRIPIARSL